MPLRMARIVLAALLAFAGTAHAEAFVAASGGRSHWNADCPPETACDTDHGAWTARAGYRFSPWLALEARYLDLGRLRFAHDVPAGVVTTGTVVTLGTTTDYSATGLGADIVATWPISQAWALSGMAGMARMRQKSALSPTDELNPFPTSETHDSTKPYYGVSISYDVGFKMLVSFEAERYRVNFGGNANVDNYAIGLTYRFR